MHGGNNFIDLTGMKFGRLSVNNRLPNIKKRVIYSCSCECGRIISVQAASLRCGSTKSCGCLRQDYMRKKATKHGYYNESLRAVWSQMRQRCRNPRNHDFHYYGARGISICQEWDEYLPFREWAMKSGYQMGLTIDRINPDGNYCPENCRWISIQEQQRNRRQQKKD